MRTFDRSDSWPGELGESGSLAEVRPTPALHALILPRSLEETLKEIDSEPSALEVAFLPAC